MEASSSRVLILSVLSLVFLCCSFTLPARAISDTDYDLNKSTVVDAPDLFQVIESMQDNTPRANFNEDSATDWRDLFLFSSKWGLEVGWTLPPEPEDVAPPLDDIVPGDLFEDTEFIYSGTQPIQFDVEPDAIDATRVAVLRGRLRVGDSADPSGVTVSVLGGPEYGFTLSRENGGYDLVANGGREQILNFSKQGYLPVQRRAAVPTRDYVSFKEVQLTPLDSKVNAIDLVGAPVMQVAEGSDITDDDGSRTARLFFPAGTQGKMKFAGGQSKPLSTMNVRATEYTVGESGPAAMPAELPPTSGYTYCLEYSVDEAMEAGATTVEFDQPVIHYVENFLGFPAGGKVPTGYYDREKGVWVAAPDGRVIEILSETAGLVELDLDGDGAADDATALAELGVTDEERQHLAELYEPGTSLWRVPMTHFTPWDCNWPYGPPQDAEPPSPPPPQDYPEEDDCEAGPGSDSGGGATGGQRGKMSGSLFQGKNQELIRQIPILGTPFTINYTSSRVPGNRKAYSADIPLSGETVPGSLMGIELEVNVAGQSFAESFPPDSGQSYGLAWDGKDGYGRKTQGSSLAHIRRGYVYEGVYYEPAEFEASFARLGQTAIESVPTRDAIILWDETQRPIGVLTVPGPEGLGGWTLNVHHTFDPVAEVLYRGDGTKRNMHSSGVATIQTFAGTFPYGTLDDGIPALEATILFAMDVAFGPDGSLYYSEMLTGVRRIGLDGRVHTIAGGGTPEDGVGDGGPATEAALGYPMGIALDKDGTLYIACLLDHRIRRVDPSGIITTVAGTGTAGFSGDGGPATEAEIMGPSDVALGPNGELYISDTGNRRIRCVGTNGIITTMAGNGENDFRGNGVPAIETGLSPAGLAAHSDGSLYIADDDNDQVFRISPEGLINVVAGTGESGYNGDGLRATDAQLDGPVAVTVTPEGVVYISEHHNYRVRRVGPTGIITTVAGNGREGNIERVVVLGDSIVNGLANEQSLFEPRGLITDEKGRLYFADLVFIRRVSSSLMSTIASEDGSELYEFDARGRHLKTLDALTGASIYSFSYDDEGLLSRIEDREGNITSIERLGDGRPWAIVAPRLQRTSFTLNFDGLLATVTDPAGQTYEITYDGSGLMTGLTDPSGHSYTHTYDAEGLLVGVQEPGGGGASLARTKLSDGYELTVTSAMGRATSYRVQHLPDGGKHLVNTFSCCERTEATIDAAGNREITYADGTVINEVFGADPRWGMQVPVVSRWTLRTPAGVTYVQDKVRSATLATPDNPLDVAGWVETATVNGRVHRLSYDGAQRLRTTQSPLGRRQFTWMDAQGRIAKRRLGNLAPIEYAYDASGRLETVTLSPGSEARVYRFIYGANGLVASAIDPLSRTTSFEYDTAGRLTRQVIPDGRAVSYTYDNNGNVTSITPPGRPAHQYAYTATNRQESYLPPDVGAGTVSTLYAYNLDNDLERITRPDGKTIDYQYDSDGRLDAIALPGGQVDFSYDSGTGRIASVGTPEGNTLSFDWDGMLLVETGWSGEVSGTVGRTYNNDLKVTRLTVGAAQSVDFGYDADSLRVQAGGLSLTRNSENGFVVATALGQVTTTENYDSFGDLESYRADDNGTLLFETQFVRDSLSRITEKTETIGGQTTTYHYIYDAAGRLQEVRRGGTTVSLYAYDENGNRASYTDENSVATTGEYDNQDRMIRYGNNTYTYTANGELLSKSRAGQTTEYDYDVLGNLRGVTLPDGTAIEYVIDGLNRRVGEKVNNALVRGFLYDDELNPVAELDGGNNPVSLFIYASRSNVPDAMVSKKADGVTWVEYRIISDHLGSPRLVVNAASGQLAQRLDYDEFGNVTRDTHPGFQPIGFAGGLYDARTGLVRFGARDYDPVSGRWTTKDPIGFSAGDPNLYGYVFADPVNRSDSSGKQASGPICQIEITMDPPEPEPGYEYKGTRVTVDGEVVAGKDVHYPKEGAAKVHSVTVVDNYKLSHDIIITYVYGKAEITVDVVKR